MVTILQNTPSKIQILAPAGSEEQLLSAVNNGCDAVYLGMDSFNARMKAPNFTRENLAKWVDYCHVFGVKVFVTINTSLKNDEFAKAVDLLCDVYKLNVDGVIVTDLALMRIAGSFPKPFEVVASTQLNVHDKYGAEFVKKCGATTVVCARECTLKQISEIAATGLNVECFLHGAMCVCQSGQCLFSSIVGGNSGNRGLCAQPCRKYYYAEEPNMGGYLLSARDMCSLSNVRQLVGAGATTFKIEGRNRRAEYGGMTSRIYRKLFDNNFEQEQGDYTLLAEMFNRAMSANNYLGGSNEDIIYPTTQNHTGIKVGQIINGYVQTATQLNKGDGLKIFDKGKEICGGIVLESGVGKVRAQFGDKVCDGFTVHRTTNVNLSTDVLSAKRKLPVDIKLIAKVGHNPQIIARCDGVTAIVEGNFIVQRAQNKATMYDELAQQLQKSGETHYTICNIVTEIDDIFIAKSQINALRRQVLDVLTQNIIKDYNERLGNRKTVDLSKDKLTNNANNLKSNVVMNGNDTKLSVDANDCDPCCAVICYDEHQLCIAHGKATYLIYKPSILNGESITVAKRYGAYVDLPSFADLNYIEKLIKENTFSICCNNIGQVEFARKYNLRYIAGAGLNLFNDSIVNEFIDADTFVYSRELTLKEISQFTNDYGLTFVDGIIPLMQLCHCPYKVAYGGSCDTCKANRPLTYKDEMGNRFTISRRRAGRCLFELLNGKKLSAVNKIKTAGRYLIDCDDAVLNHYINLNHGVIDDYAETVPYTKGRLFEKIN